MSEPFTIAKPRGRLIVNRLSTGETSLTIECRGSGHTILLTRADEVTLAHALAKRP